MSIDERGFPMFYCDACKTHFPTEGDATPSPDDLETELNEHIGDFHD